VKILCRELLRSVQYFWILLLALPSPRLHSKGKYHRSLVSVIYVSEEDAPVYDTDSVSVPPENLPANEEKANYGKTIDKSQHKPRYHEY
jgi:hypothetical protein